MNITMFNFLEDNAARIVDEAIVDFRRECPACSSFPDAALRTTVGDCLDSIVDTLVVGESGNVEPACAKASQEILSRPSEVQRGVLQIPLRMLDMIRRLYAEEFAAEEHLDPVQRFDITFDDLEQSAHRVVCIFVDVFQEALEARVRRRMI